MRTNPDRRLYLALVVGVVAVAVRLIWIDQPFTDKWSWRQSDVASIARNYLWNGFHFAYPQIDWAGEQPGYVGTEFPILPFIAAVCYKLAGVHEWVGRAQSVIFFAVSLPFFFLLVRDAFGEAPATWALFFYSFSPLSLMTSRCFMPDMPSLSLSIIGFYFFSRWTASGSWKPFCLAALAISFALLIKVTSVLIGAPLFYLAYERFREKTYWRRELWIFALIVLLPSALWYSHAYNVAARFYPHHFFGAGGIRIMNAGWYWSIAEQTAVSSLTIVLVLLAVAGFFLTRRLKRAPIFSWWLAATVIFIIVVGYGNRHPWYQLPLVPIAAAYAGFAVSFTLSRLERWRSLEMAFALLLVVAFTSESYFEVRKLYRPSAAELRDLGLALKARTPPSSVVIVPDYGDPTALYYAERKGWHFLEIEGTYNGHPTDGADAINDLEQLRAHGATHIAFYQKTFWWLTTYKEFAEHLNNTATLVDAPEQWKIYKLTGSHP